MTDCGLPPVDLRQLAGALSFGRLVIRRAAQVKRRVRLRGELDAMLRALALLGGIIALTACATGTGVSRPGVGTETDFSQEPIFLLTDIAGKEAADLDALLGEPEMTRSEGRGEFRRYGLASCALFVILYPDENGVKRAASVNAGALKSGEEKPDLDLCLAHGRLKEF
ncbi:MAG: hypothetical protein ABL957_16795 [Parvularculaceae bacterium]